MTSQSKHAHTNFFVHLSLLLEGTSISGKDVEWSLISTGFPACQSIDITKYSAFRNLNSLFVVIYFNKLNNLGVSLTIEDREKSLKKRSLRSQTQEYDGSRIDIDDLSSGLYKRLFLKLEQNIHMESDLGINCKNYPTNDYTSFGACDESYVYNTMRNKHKVMPFWAAKNIEEVSNNRYVIILRLTYDLKKNVCKIKTSKWKRT